MIKFYCDICGKELKENELKRLSGTVGLLSFEIITAIKNVWNAGNVCFNCIRNAIKKAETQ